MPAKGSKKSKAVSSKAAVSEGPTAMRFLDGKISKTASIAKQQTEWTELITSLTKAGSGGKQKLFINDIIQQFLVTDVDAPKSVPIGHIGPHINARGAKSKDDRAPITSAMASRGWDLDSQIGVVLTDPRDWTEEEKAEDRGIDGSGALKIKYLYFTSTPPPLPPHPPTFHKHSQI
jgi:hypothetical protein